MEGQGEGLGLLLPALAGLLLGREEAGQVSTGAPTAFLQLPDPGFQTLLL